MTRRDQIVLAVVAVVGAIAASWLLVISPKRDQAAKLESKIQSTQSSLNNARSVLAQAQAARSSFRGSYTTLVRLGEAVPTDDDVPSLIYQVQSAANATGVDFGGLSVNPSGAAASTPSTPPSGGTTGSSTPATPSTPAASTTGTSSTAPLPPGVTVGPAGFPVEPFNFTFQGNFFHLANFFGRLERFVQATNKRISVSGRLLTLEAINLAPSAAGFPQIQATVSATTYLLPASQGLVEGATPAGPSQTAVQPASTSSPQSSSSSAPPAAVVTR
jgi:type II secretory pathway pseudopilin PulG